MRQALLIIDVQPCFSPPQWLIDGIQSLIGKLPSVATVERHDESRTPFQRQQSLNLDRVLVCGLQTETCCLAAGLALLPTLLTDLTVG